MKNHYPSFTFENEFTEKDEAEMQLKGYRADIIVNCLDGKSYRLCFYDDVRLLQDLSIEEILFFLGLVLVKDVTLANIDKAIKIMWDSDFFKNLKSIS